MGLKNKYVIDECCIYHAANLVDKHDNEDYSSLIMLAGIIDHCDAILINDELLGNYRRIISVLEKNGDRSHYFLVKILNNILPNQNKLVNWKSELYRLPFEEDLPPDDIYLVRLSKISNSILVTSDEKLVSKVEPNSVGFSEKYQIKIYTPLQVIHDLAKKILNQK